MFELGTTSKRARGSALVIVLVVLLALSALGMVAVQAVGNSVERAGGYRVRSTATRFSSAAARFVAKRASESGGQFMAAFDKGSSAEMDGQSFSKRQGIASRGGYKYVVQDSDSSLSEGGFEELERSDNETGLFTDSGGGSSVHSFESRHEDSKFEVIMRNPSGSMPAPGYSQEYCFKTVTIAANARLGPDESDWTQSEQVGTGTHSMEAMVGPIGQCGSE